MFAYDPGDGGGAAILPVAPPPPVLAPPPPAPPPAPAVPAVPRNANGETLGEAEAAVLAEVARGALGADALARHPLPPGTSAEEALRFLASLPQTVYQSGQPGGVVVGPPVDALPAGGSGGGTVGFLPGGGDSGSDGAGGDDRSLESAYKAPGVGAQWRNLIDVFKIKVPSQHAAVNSVFDTPKELFR